jgi:hypothetical protein
MYLSAWIGPEASLAEYPIMANGSSSGFHYNEQLFAKLERTISRERLRRYLQAGHQDMANALWLYETNVELSEALYGIVQGVEVALRNACHHELAGGYGTGQWYLVAPMSSYLQDKVQSAIQKSGGPRAVPGQVMTELSLGFWVDLLASGSEKAFWIPHLHRAFPFAKGLHPLRPKVHQRFERLRWLRNRIAHHEPILTTRGSLYTGHGKFLTLDEVDECLRWICPDTARWLRARSRFYAAEDLLGQLTTGQIQL